MRFAVFFRSINKTVPDRQVKEVSMQYQERWERKIREFMDTYGIAGLAVAVSDREKILWHNAYGVTSVEKPWDKVTTQTLFRIASCTKITLGILVMRLVEEGRLDLDAPIIQYVPWLQFRDNSTRDRITIRRLLSHSAGLPSEYTPDGPHDEDKLEEVLKEGLSTLEPVTRPEDQLYYYSNWGIRLVAYAVQSIMGKPFTQLEKEYILQPLGMDHTTFTLCEAATFSLAVPHRAGQEVLHYIPVNATRHAVGGLFSTVDDMAKLARLLLNDGAPLISPASMREMMTPQTSLYLNYRNEYGITMRLKQYKTIALAGHDGQSPPYFASIWTVPERGFAVTLTLNTDGGDILSTNLIPELILDDLCALPKSVELWESGRYCPERERLHEGTYLGDANGLFSLQMIDGKPVLRDKDGEHLLYPHSRSGVYYYTAGTQRVCVGLPAVNGGSADHLMLQSLLCRRVDAQPLPANTDLREYEGAYGTVLERYIVRCSESGLSIEKNGGTHACVYVFGDTFACDLGAVIFIRMHQKIVGVRVGSSTTHNKR